MADLNAANSVVPNDSGPISDSNEMILLAVLAIARVLVTLILSYHKRKDGQKGDY